MAKLQPTIISSINIPGSGYRSLGKNAGELAAVIEKKIQTATRLESSNPQSIRAQYLRSDISKLQSQLQALRKLTDN